VRDLLPRYCPDLAKEEAMAVAALAEGSIGRALELVASGGVELSNTLTAMLNRRSGIDVTALHGFAERLARADAEDNYRAVEELLRQHLASKAIAAARLGTRAEAARWARVRAEISDGFARADGLNLDKKQTVMNAFFAIEQASA
jgi:DNA polymerase-3 subunit delta'